MRWVDLADVWGVAAINKPGSHPRRRGTYREPVVVATRPNGSRRRKSAREHPAGGRARCPETIHGQIVQIAKLTTISVRPGMLGLLAMVHARGTPAETVMCPHRVGPARDGQATRCRRAQISGPILFKVLAHSSHLPSITH